MRTEDLYNNQNKRSRFLCDVCGYEWTVRHKEDLLRKNLSLEDDLLEDNPTKCPSCGNSYISEL
ncbi:MAG: hypothetical protein AB1297_02480 [bacterium]